MATATMSKPTVVKSTTDEQTKREATAIYNRLGMSLSAAINVFLHQSIIEGGMPFTPQLPVAPVLAENNPRMIHAKVEEGKLLMPSTWRDVDDDDEW